MEQSFVLQGFKINGNKERAVQICDTTELFNQNEGETFVPAHIMGGLKRVSKSQMIVRESSGQGGGLRGWGGVMLTLKCTVP